MRFFAHKRYGTVTLIPTIVLDIDLDILYIPFLFWEIGIEW